MICIKIVSILPKYLHSNLANLAGLMMTSGYFENRIFNNGSLSVSPSYIFLHLTLSIYIKLTISVWADNADACSTQYAGTGALKTDFTR